MFNREEFYIISSDYKKETEHIKHQLIIDLMKTSMSLYDMSTFLKNEAVRHSISPDLPSLSMDGITSSITRMLNARVYTRQDHDVVFKTIANGTHYSKKNIYITPIYDPQVSQGEVKTRNKVWLPYSFARWEDGTLKKPSDFKEWFSSKNMTRVLLQTAFLADDLEGVEMVLNIPRVRKAIDSDLAIFIKKWNIPLDYKVNGILNPKIKSKALYAQNLIDICRADDAARLKSAYQSEFSEEVGHAIICSIIEMDNKTSELLACMLVKDKADWYIGIKQNVMGQAAYFDLKDRVRNACEEVKDVFEKHPIFFKSPAVLAGILSSLPEQTIVDAISNKKTAEAVHRATGIKSLLSLTSPAYRKSKLGMDLNL